MVLSVAALVQTDNGRIVYFRHSDLPTEIRIFQEIEETDELTRNEIRNLTSLIRTSLENTKFVYVRIYLVLCDNKIYEFSENYTKKNFLLKYLKI